MTSKQFFDLESKLSSLRDELDFLRGEERVKSFWKLVIADCMKALEDTAKKHFIRDGCKDYELREKLIDELGK